jgi:regulatory protein
VPDHVITALEVQKRNQDRVNVYLDGEFAFGLSALEAVRLRKGQRLTDAEVTVLREADVRQQAVESAAHFLGYRPRSMAEVRQNLVAKEFAPDVIEAAVERLQAMGFVDDAAFARYWAQNRSEFKPLSRRALKVELRRKGVADDAISAALADVDETSGAYQAASKQVRKLRGLTKREFKVKLSAFLQRRGFSFDTTQDTVLRLMDELEAQDAMFFQPLNQPTDEE